MSFLLREVSSVVSLIFQFCGPGLQRDEVACSPSLEKWRGEGRDAQTHTAAPEQGGKGAQRAQPWVGV